MINNLQWNIFRNLGDYTHMFGIAVVLYSIFFKRSLVGFSFKTQVLYLTLYSARYLDIFYFDQCPYLVSCKLGFFFTSVLLVARSWFLIRQQKQENSGKNGNSTYEVYNDTVMLRVIIIPCLIAGYLFSSSRHYVERLWTFSEFLEGFAMIPQYVFVYRENSRVNLNLQSDRLPSLIFMIAFGTYRCFYAMNWFYKYIMIRGYHDYQSWAGGAIEIVFFFDFLIFQFDLLWKRSMLRDLVLSVDDTVTEVSEKIEVKIMGEERGEQLREYKTEMMELRARRDLKRRYSSGKIMVMNMQDGL